MITAISCTDATESRGGVRLADGAPVEVRSGEIFGPAPQTRPAVRDVIRGTRDGGTTAVLTTHFTEEAERLCERMAIANRGGLVAPGAVPCLIASPAAGRGGLPAAGGPPRGSGIGSIPARVE